LKVLFPIGSFFPSQSGGPNNTIYWMTKALKLQDVKPIIVTTNDGLKDIHKIKTNEWIDKDYGLVWYQKTRIHYLPIKCILKVFSQMSDTKVIHLTSIFYPLSWITATLNLFYKRKPIIWSPRGELDPAALIYSYTRKKILLFYIKTFFKNSTIFHATCKEEASYLMEIFGNNIKVVTVANFMPLQAKVKAINKDNYILFLGRIHPKKAIENLINSLKESKKFTDQNYKLLIAGEGDSLYLNQLKRLVVQLEIEEKVHFLGHIEGAEKQKYLQNAKVLVMPSHTENFGNVVIEALAWSTPVIASTGTPWEILEAEKSGYWVNNNPESLANAIDKILSLDKDEYMKMCLNARTLVENHFEVNENISKWVDIYNKALYE